MCVYRYLMLSVLTSGSIKYMYNYCDTTDSDFHSLNVENINNTVAEYK